MAFNIDQMVTFCSAQLTEFSKKHPNETFYAFAMDSSLLCLNSMEHASRTLTKYRTDWDRTHRFIEKWEDLTNEDLENSEFILDLEERFNKLDRSDRGACLDVINRSRTSQRDKGNPYTVEEEIVNLKYNTGDWEYQGFAKLSNTEGFDEDLYQKHYEVAMEDETGHAAHTEYAMAMDALIERLVKEKAFSTLQLTPDFKATWYDHTY